MGRSWPSPCQPDSRLLRLFPRPLRLGGHGPPRLRAGRAGRPGRPRPTQAPGATHSDVPQHGNGPAGAPVSSGIATPEGVQLEWPPSCRKRPWKNAAGWSGKPPRTKQGYFFSTMLLLLVLVLVLVLLLVLLLLLLLLFLFLFLIFFFCCYNYYSYLCFCSWWW